MILCSWADSKLSNAASANAPNDRLNAKNRRSCMSGSDPPRAIHSSACVTFSGRSSPRIRSSILACFGADCSASASSSVCLRVRSVPARRRLDSGVRLTQMRTAALIWVGPSPTFSASARAKSNTTTSSRPDSVSPENGIRFLVCRPFTTFLFPPFFACGYIVVHSAFSSYR